MDNREISMVLASLDKQINDLKKPDGSKANPARTCKDLFLCNPEFESGIYYIDPNQGCTADAISVACIKESGETCVEPRNSSFAKDTWYNGPAKALYMSSVFKGKRIEYNVSDLSQLTFLRLLTTTVSQDIIYLCRNSIADLKLLTTTEVELTKESSDPMNVYEIEDNCVVDGQWHEARLSYTTTTRSSRLPIIDVATSDIGRGQEFGWEIGPVCFV